MNWDEFRKTVFLYWVRSGKDVSYVNHIGGECAFDFLNAYGCRLAEAMKEVVEEVCANINGILEVVQDTTIYDADFAGNEQLIDAVRGLYGQVKAVNGIGPTSTAKLLHFRQPKLFVMWDGPVLREYDNMHEDIRDSPEGFLSYLQVMQQEAIDLRAQFDNAALEMGYENPQSYLSAKLGYNPPKTMAKFLDEYNWMRYTKGFWAQTIEAQHIEVDFDQ